MSALVTSEASMVLVSRSMNKPMYTSDLEPFFYKSGHSIRRLFGEEPYLERKKTVNPLAVEQGFKDVYSKCVSKKPNLIRAPYRKRDGDLHPLVFSGWDMLVNENTIPVGPGYQFQALIKDKRYDEHNFIIMPLAVRRVFSKDLTMSIYGSSLSANSSHNRLFFVRDANSLCELQLQAVHWTLEYVKEICPDLRGAGCHCLLVALMSDMNWIVQSMIKYSNLPSTSKFESQDEPQKIKKFAYLDAIKSLITLVKQVQMRTGFTIKFWPTSGEDLNGLTARAEQLLEGVSGNQKLMYQQLRPEDYALKFPSTPAPIRHQQLASTIRTGTDATSEDSKENYTWQTLDSTPGPSGCQIAHAQEGLRVALSLHAGPSSGNARALPDSPTPSGSGLRTIMGNLRVTGMASSALDEGESTRTSSPPASPLMSSAGIPGSAGSN